MTGTTPQSRKARPVQIAFLTDIHSNREALTAVLAHARARGAQRFVLLGDYVGYGPDPEWTIETIAGLVAEGAIAIRGNHDEAARDYVDLHFGGVAVVMDAIHTGADGRRWLVLHGDAFDGVVKYARWLAHLGDWAYNIALTLNTWFNRLRRRLGYSYWSLSAYLKHKVKNAVDYISSFETAVAEEARRHHVDGVICGHIHHAEIRDIDGVTYCNDGDWVESCTALVEHGDGRMEILNWAQEYERRHSRKRSREPLALPA